jgi:hypothetical protein
MASKPIPGVMTAAVVFMVILMILMYAVFLGPFAWLSWRNMKLHLRYIRENRVARRLFHAHVIILAGCFGMLLNLYLIDLLGRHLWPSIFR